MRLPPSLSYSPVREIHYLTVEELVEELAFWEFQVDYGRNEPSRRLAADYVLRTRRRLADFAGNLLKTASEAKTLKTHLTWILRDDRTPPDRTAALASA